METSIQKNEQSHRAKYESDRHQYSSIIAQYEKKLEDVSATHERLKCDREIELEKTRTFYESNLSKTQEKMKELESITQTGINNFKSELTKAA
jgi:hypothetical protein